MDDPPEGDEGGHTRSGRIPAMNVGVYAFQSPTSVPHRSTTATKQMFGPLPPVPWRP